MAATERLVVLMTPEEKRQLEARAKKAGVRSTAEFVRGKMAQDDEALDPVEREVWRVFRDTLYDTIEVMNKSFDEIQRTLDQTISAYEQRHGVKL